MLHVYFGDLEGSIYNTAVYFKNTYLGSWITDPLARKMIKDVDGSEVLGENLIRSRQLGLVPPTSLSGGVKTLLLIHNEPDKVFNASTCGDNCAKWILRMAKERDVTIALYHIMDFGRRPFDAVVDNTGQVVHSMSEFYLVAAACLEQMG